MNIIITGASSGIGYEAAKLFAGESGNRIIVISRNAEKLDELVKSCRKDGFTGLISAFPFDLANGNIAGELIPALAGFMKNIDILVNNAGQLVNKPFDQLTETDFEMVFGSNVKGPFLLIKALLPYFSENSHIVNIGSMGGYQGSAKFKGLSLYSSSKGALAILTECLAEELKDRKIFVNCLALGSAQTEMLSQAFPGYQAPLTAREMAEFIVDFSVRGHRWFNGKVLPVSLSTP